jgi:Transcription factor WhiB
MTESRSLAPADPGPAAHSLDVAIVWLRYRSVPLRLTDAFLWALVIKHARCPDSGLDPDQWFPVSADAGKARQEAAAAIGICTACPVRAQCLALSLRHWDIGQHGIWGGLVAADRAALRPLQSCEAGGPTA